MNGNDANSKIEQLEREIVELKAAIIRPRLVSRLITKTNVLLGTLLVALRSGAGESRFIPV